MKPTHFGLAVVVALVGLPLGYASADTFDLATGQNPQGTISGTADVQDLNWFITTQGSSTPRNSPNTYVVGPSSPDAGFFGGWVANSTTSSWIAPNPDNAGFNGNYAISYSFNISGTPTSATCTGCQWTIDDNGTLSINGNVISTLTSGPWTSFHAFSIPLADLVSGTNVLSVVSFSSDNNFEGVNLEGSLSVSTTPSAVPLPAALPLFATGLAGLGLLGWRRKKKAAA